MSEHRVEKLDSREVREVSFCQMPPPGSGLRKLAALEAEPPELSFWKTSAGQEVDFLIERGGEAVGLEVKWSSRIDRRQIQALSTAGQALGKSWRLGVLIHGGTETVAIDAKTAAIPAAAAFQGSNTGT